MRIRMNLHPAATALELSRPDLPGVLPLSRAWTPVDDPLWQAALREPRVRKYCADWRIEVEGS